jgi:ubiquinone/menaquinone biosynthesis C-methylase UbiE
MKDRFSDVAKDYAQYRPKYPQGLYNFLLKRIDENHLAWDIATGNGQVASELAQSFQKVCATDISARQLQEATTTPNIEYTQQAAEKTSFPNHSFDLITVAQAIHWFNVDEFYAEVKRTLKPNGILAVWGYGLIETSGSLNNILKEFYASLKDYWDSERKHIDDHYSKIPFPFKQISTPSFAIEVTWDYEHLLGYLSTWSALKQYVSKHHNDPIADVAASIQKHWGDHQTRDFSFPIFMKVGRQ